MFALKWTVNLKICTTRVRKHDADTVLLVLKSGLVVFVIVIITIIRQVFLGLCIHLLQYQFWVKYSNFQNHFFSTPQKICLQPSTGLGHSLINLQNYIVWSVMRTYPHKTHQVVMWHLYLLVPHWVFSLLWHQH